MKLYHATFRAYLSEITKTGLLPGCHKNWRDCASAIYLANDPDVAVSFCEAAEDTPDTIFDSGICCFEVASEVLDPGLLSHDPNILEVPGEFSGCYAYAGEIPMSVLHLCWTEDTGLDKPALDAQIQTASTRAISSAATRKRMNSDHLR